MKLALIVGCIITMTCLAGPTRAAAQEEQHDDEARSLFDAGRLALQAGRFEEAYGHFSRAYELSPRPPLLYNMGVTADRLHRYQDAMNAFRRYLDVAGEVENRAEVERRIQILQESLDRERSLSEASAAASTAGESSSETASGGGGGGFPLLWTFVVGGVALVTGGLAVGFWVAANDGYAELADSCGATAAGCSEDQIGSVDTNVTLTNAFMITSLVLVAATGAVLGLELALADGGGGESASLRIGPGALSLQGTFQ